MIDFAIAFIFILTTGLAYGLGRQHGTPKRRLANDAELIARSHVRAWERDTFRNRDDCGF